MPRLRNQFGVVVSVSDETAALLGREWVAADAEPAAPKAAPRKRTAAKPAEAEQE